jgi:hypothetical protein
MKAAKLSEGIAVNNSKKTLHRTATEPIASELPCELRRMSIWQIEFNALNQQLRMRRQNEARADS